MPATAAEPRPSSEAFTPAPGPALERSRLPLGPIETVHAYWLAGGSCDGCSIAITGGTTPALEGLLTGTVPGLPKVVLHHPVLAVEAGNEFMASFHTAWRGELGAPYVVFFEGSIPDERIAARDGGFWSAMGVEERDGLDGLQPVPTAEWLRRLAPGSAAVIAVGTCATWGGIPAAEGNPTGAMGTMDFLGKDFRSAFGLPIINIPGCAPQGDNMTETVMAILLFLQGLGPLPEFDELGRPAWLFNETVHRGCTRGGFYEEGIFAHEFGGAECLVEVGCWGPVVDCNIVKRGAINHMGGCMEVGGPCIGCTMPGFPDKFSPFYKPAPGAIISTTTSRVVGGMIRRLRRLSRLQQSRTNRWFREGDVPSGWGHAEMPGPVDKALKFFYEKWQFLNSKRPGRPRGREARYWGVDRSGKESDYHDDTSTKRAP